MPNEQPNDSFPACHRLMRAHEFDAVFRDCEVRVSSRALLFLAKQNGRGFNRLGMVVSKKNIPGAVARNRVKRQIRESFRRMPASSGPGLDLLVLARPAAQTEGNLAALLEKSLEKLVARAKDR